MIPKRKNVVPGQQCIERLRISTPKLTWIDEKCVINSQLWQLIEMHADATS